MGRTTKIDWCDSSWNPVTGCLHDCKYCYARGIARRFGGGLGNRNAWELDAPMHRTEPCGSDKLVRVGPVQPYPFDFDPTLHRYKLDEPQGWKKPKTIFVCSMADLFGKWVPEEWIESVLESCRKAPQHRYLFLTKKPDRYDELEDKGIITEQDQNFWLGSTTTDITKDRLHWSFKLNTFQSCEPMLAPWLPAGKPNEKYRGGWPKWVIFGAETGNRKEKVVPKKEWIVNAVKQCRNMGAAVFMKESLREIVGDDFVQEFPW